MTPEQTAALAAVRARFDAVDDVIVAAILERLRLADEAAAIKQAAAAPVLDAGREAASAARRRQVLDGLLGHGDDDDGLDVRATIDGVFDVLVAASRARQGRRLR